MTILWVLETVLDFYQIGMLFFLPSLFINKKMQKKDYPLFVISIIVISICYQSKLPIMLAYPLMGALIFLVQNIYIIVVVKKLYQIDFSLSSALFLVTLLLTLPGNLIASFFSGILKANIDLMDLTIIYSIFIDLNFVVISKLLITAKPSLKLKINNHVRQFKKHYTSLFLLLVTAGTLSSVGFESVDNLFEREILVMHVIFSLSIIFILFLLAMKIYRTNSVLKQKQKAFQSYHQMVEHYYNEISHLKHDKSNMLIAIKHSMASNHIYKVSLDQILPDKNEDLFLSLEKVKNKNLRGILLELRQIVITSGYNFTIDSKRGIGDNLKLKNYKKLYDALLSLTSHCKGHYKIVLDEKNTIFYMNFMIEHQNNNRDHKKVIRQLNMQNLSFTQYEDLLSVDIEIGLTS